MTYRKFHMDVIEQLITCDLEWFHSKKKIFEKQNFNTENSLTVTSFFHLPLDLEVVCLWSLDY